MKIEVPIKAISVNVCWQGKRFKTKEYKDWREAFCFMVIRAECVENPTKLIVDFYVSNFASDLDNLLKPVLDALQEGGIIRNDKTIESICARKIKCPKGEEKIELELL